MLDVLGDPGFLIPYALVQAAVLLAVVHLSDVYEREPVGVLALMALWGATFAPALSLTFGRWVLERLAAEDAVTRAMSAALVEEPVKGVALVAAASVSLALAHRLGSLQLEGPMDGLVYGVAIGLGFSFTEDVFFLIKSATTDEGLSIFADRADFLGLSMLSHSVWTGTFGAALGAAVWRKSWFDRVLFGAIGLAAAICMHAAHNGLAAAGRATATRLLDYLLVVAFITAIVLSVRRQQRVILDELADERDRGLISGEEWANAPRVFDLWRLRWRLARSGDAHELRRVRALHHALVDLAFAKHRAHVVGETSTDVIAHHRAAVASLSAGGDRSEDLVHGGVG